MTDPLERLRIALGDRYDLERQVGEGGMAVVYRAKDVKHERTVAIKVLRQELSVSLGADRFLREIRVAANLQHPNILALYDSGEAEGLLYYVMPFVDGESLRDRLNREQQLPLQDALQIVRESAEALQYAHERGIVHRDIKPENILLQGGHAVVADFGIARAVSSAGGEKLTQTGMAVGTPHYMSPEQSLGSDHVDARSDIYSLGCVLYEVLIGQPPFTGPNSMAIMARHSMEVVPSLQVVRASVPDEVEDVVMQALEKTPADRFQTMTEFAERLAEAEAEAAVARTAQRRANTAARRAAASGAMPRRKTMEVEAPAPAGRGAKFWGIAAGGALVLLAGLGFGLWKFTHRGAAGGGGAAEGLDPKRIAVMYFRQRGGADSLGYLADGLTEALIHELSQVKPLQVVSGNGVAPYKNKDVPTDSIAHALRVGTILQGSVAQADNRLRVSVSLVDAATGSEIGSKTLERPRTEIFALQDDLAKEVSIFLRDKLGQEIQVRETRASTSNTAAWDLLQKADQLSKETDNLLNSGDTAAAGRYLTQADSLLAQAEALDNKWPRPAIERAWLAYRQSDLVGFDKDLNAKWVKVGLEHADRALALQPNEPDALEIRGTLEYWKWLLNLEPDQTRAAKLVAQAEQDLRSAVTANPTAAWAWTVLSFLLVGEGQTAEGKLAAQRSYEADPYLRSAKQTIWRLFQASIDLEDAGEARHWCEEGQRRFGDYYRFTECRIWLYALKETPPDVKQAWKLYDQFVEATPPALKPYHKLYGKMLVAMALVRAGLPDSARSVVEKSRGDASVDPTHDLAYYEALVRMLLSDQDEAVKLLSTYVAANPQMRESIGKDETWWFRDIKSNARFKSLFGIKG